MSEPQDVVENPRQNVSFASGDATVYGYLALPDRSPAPGVVVLQEWWGLVDNIVDVCDLLAREGYVALAPDLYGGRTTHDPDLAQRYMDELPVDQAARDLAGSVDYLLARAECSGSAVGAIGFCMGGGLGLALGREVGEKLGALVIFYPTGEVDDLSPLRAPVLGHWGELDEYSTPEVARRLERQIREQAHVEVTMHVYPDADHAFFNDSPGHDAYREDASEQAWERTKAFLKRHLG